SSEAQAGVELAAAERARDAGDAPERLRQRPREERRADEHEAEHDDDGDVRGDLHARRRPDESDDPVGHEEAVLAPPDRGEAGARWRGGGWCVPGAASRSSASGGGGGSWVLPTSSPSRV